MIPQTLSQLKISIKDNYLQLTLISIFAGFALAPLYRHIYALLAIAGLYLIITQFKDIRQNPQVRQFTILFLCIWIPMLASLADAEFFNRSFSTTMRFLAYLLAAIAIITFARKQASQKLLLACYFILLFLSLDGLLQWVTGTNIVGHPPYRDQRVVGMFYPEPALSLFLATFSVLFFEAVRQLQAKYKFAWLSIIPLVMVIILGASRSAWMLFALSIGIYCLYFLRCQTQIQWKKIAIRGITIAVISIVAALQSDYIQQRADLASGLFSGDYEQMNTATSARLPLWKTAVAMTESHWINGVGPRAFTLSYDQHSDKDNYWHGIHIGQPHLYLLEISSETGLIGLFGYACFLVLLLRMLWKQSKSGFHRAIPWGMAAFVASFPLNSTIPLFGYFGAQMLWFPLTLFVILSDIKTPNSGAIAKDQEKE